MHKLEAFLLGLDPALHFTTPEPSLEVRTIGAADLGPRSYDRRFGLVVGPIDTDAYFRARLCELGGCGTAPPSPPAASSHPSPPPSHFAI